MDEQGTVPGMLAARARERPDDTALATLGEKRVDLSYREWCERASRLAQVLAQRGVRHGARVVVVCQDDWLAFAVAYVATQWTGATAVPVPIESGLGHVASVARVTSAVAILGIRGLGDTSAWQALVSDLEREDVPAAGFSPRAEPDNVAELLYTSGTTGTPKRIAATHRNLVWPLQNVKDHGPRTVLHSLLAGSNAGQTLLIQTLSPVRHTVLTVPFAPVHFLGAIEAHRPSDVVLVPAQAVRLVRAGAGRGFDLTSVRGVRNTSAAITPATLAALARLFSAARVTNVYTTSEAWPARVGMEYDPARPLSVGRPTGGTDIRIVDDAGHEVEHEVRGRVQLRMATAPARWYDGDAAASERVFDAQGWIDTGDIGYVADGCLFLAGRSGEIINSGGLNISPLEVNAVLEEHPHVMEAFTFGAAHPTLGEYVVSAVVVSSEVPADSLRAWVEQTLGRARAPRRIYFVEELPRTGNGKVSRAALAQRLHVRVPLVADAETFEAVRRIWATALDLELEEVDAGSDYMELGGSSIEAASITLDVRRATGGNAREGWLYEARSLQEYVDRVLRADRWEGAADDD